VSDQRALCGAALFTLRNEALYPSLEGSPFKQYAALTLQAADTDIGSQPYYLPVITTARVFLLQADDIAQSYFHYHNRYLTD
jgi:hypothetical protein